MVRNRSWPYFKAYLVVGGLKIESKSLHQDVLEYSNSYTTQINLSGQRQKNSRFTGGTEWLINAYGRGKDKTAPNARGTRPGIIHCSAWLGPFSDYYANYLEKAPTVTVGTGGFRQEAPWQWALSKKKKKGTSAHLSQTENPASLPPFL